MWELAVRPLYSRNRSERAECEDSGCTDLISADSDHSRRPCGRRALSLHYDTVVPVVQGLESAKGRRHNQGTLGRFAFTEHDTLTSCCMSLLGMHME